MSNQILNFGSAVIEHCKDGNNGTAFISTNNNKSCQVVITNGEIKAIIMGRIKGHDAITEVEKAGIKGVSFNDRIQLPFKEDAAIESSDAILNSFGYGSPQKDVLKELLDPDTPDTNTQEVVEKTVRKMKMTAKPKGKVEDINDDFDSKSDEELLRDLIESTKQMSSVS